MEAIQKLHVSFEEGVSPEGPLHPRAYTLTHSDATGDLFLTIGRDVNHDQISGWYTRFMRDEVVAMWETGVEPALHVHCHVSGGFVLGSASWRDAIFRRHLPMVMTAFRYGDRVLFEQYPALDDAQALVHFHARQQRFDRTESFGTLGDYQAGSDRNHGRASAETSANRGTSIKAR
jgi:hypothetical protein